MEELASGGFVGKFGLDVRLLVAQVVNFLVVLLILSRFVFRPLLAAMRQRTERIAKGLEEAEYIRKEKQQFLAWQEIERKRAHAEGAALLTRAEQEARTRREMLIRQAEAEAGSMHDRAVEEARRIHDDAIAAAKKDVGTLVVDVSERVLRNRLTPAQRETFLQDTLEEVRRHAGGSR